MGLINRKVVVQSEQHIRTAHTSKDDASFEDFRLFTIDHFQKRRETFTPARLAC